MEYKLIASDIDGTLLDSNEKISEENRRAIIDIQKRGIKFVLASGRPSYGMFSIARELEMEKWGGYIVSFNGGEVIDCSNHKIICREALTGENVREIYRTSKEIGIDMVLYHNDTVYGTDDLIKIEADLCKMKFIKFDDIDKLEEKIITNSTKCMFISDEKSIKKAEVLMKKKYGDSYFISTSKPIFLEIANKNVNKGKALKKLGEIIGISTEEMIAIGDGENDISLLEVAGMPAAVKNAVPKLKKIAKFESTSNNESALSTLIGDFFE